MSGPIPRDSVPRAASQQGVPARRGQALLETALVLPVLLLLAFGVVGVGRVVQAQMGVSAVAREAARVATLAQSPAEATTRGVEQAQEVARGYGLKPGGLQVSVEPGDLARGSQVRGTARYDVTFDDLPLLGWARLSVVAEHVERVDLYRSRWPGGQ